MKPSIYSKVLRAIIGVTGMLAAVMLFTVPAFSADEGSIIRGAQLYDKWYAVIKADKPEGTHPAWPAANENKKGATTWRCKSCHGWDNKGAAGAYGSGSYDTGIKGVDGMAGAELSAIVAVIKDDTHQLAGLMDEQDYLDLALFVSEGQVDMSQYIDLGTKALLSGDAAKGANYYNTMCAQCHSPEGFLPKDMEKTLGKQMGNPWEVMHKILNGQPNEQMPALRALDRGIVLDLMAHMATMPVER